MIPLEPFIDGLTRADGEIRTWEEMRIDREEIGVAFRNINLQSDSDDRVREVLFVEGYLLTR